MREMDHDNYKHLHTVLPGLQPGLQINPYFTDISGLSWTRGMSQFYEFISINFSAISVCIRIIILHVIAGSPSVFELTDNSYIAVFSIEVGQTMRVLVVQVVPVC